VRKRIVPGPAYDVIYEFLVLCGAKDPTPDQIANIFRNKELMVMLSDCTSNNAYAIVENALYPAPPVSFRDIAQATASAFEVKLVDILGKSQQRHVVLARDMAIYMIKFCQGSNYSEIARYLGRSRSSVSRSHNKLVEKMDFNEPENFLVGKTFEISANVLPTRRLVF